MIRLEQLHFNYDNGVKALDDVSLTIEHGEFVFVVGSSGSGKSTLLKTLYRELTPQEGEVWVDEQAVHQLKSREIPYLRRKIGVIFQDFKLLPNKTASENIAYALEVTGWDAKEIPEKVEKALTMVHLRDKGERLPSEMSGGEQQRVAIARALVNNPSLLVADEPTGNLDPISSRNIMEILSDINRSGTTVVVATHDSQIVDSMQKRVLAMHKGKLSSDLRKASYHEATGLSQQPTPISPLSDGKESS